MIKSVLVTGATGFVGQAVVRRLLSSGFQVRALSRQHAPWPFDPHGSLERVEGDMRSRKSIFQAVKGMDAVIHLAARKSDERDSQEVNVEGAKALRDACEKENVQYMVNISTQSTKLKRKGTYARTKDEADHILSNGSIPTLTLRCSLIYGGDGSGVFDTILRYATLPVVPVIGSGETHFRPVHRDDLADAILFALTKETPMSGTYDVGGPDSISFNDMVKAVLKAKQIQRPLLHLPIFIALPLAYVLSVLPKPPLTVSNVLGAAEDVAMDIDPLQRDFHVHFRSFTEALPIEITAVTRAISRTDAEQEATVLLEYVLSSSDKWMPTQDDVTRLLQAFSAHSLPNEPTLSSSVRSRQWLLRAVDTAVRLRRKPSVLHQKLLIAAAIAECSPASADSFLPRDRSVTSVLFDLLGTGFSTLFTYIIAIPLLLFPGFLRRNAELR